MSGVAGPRVFVPPPMIFAVAVAGGMLVDSNMPDWRHMGRPLQAVGIGVVLAGLALMLVSLCLFHRFQTRPEPWKSASALIRSGPYRFTRNPMYLGMALMSAGLAMVCESLAAGAAIAVAILILDRIVIAREEGYLLRRFGTDYAAYRSQVRRWL